MVDSFWRISKSRLVMFPVAVSGERGFIHLPRAELGPLYIPVVHRHTKMVLCSSSKQPGSLPSVPLAVKLCLDFGAGDILPRARHFFIPSSHLQTLRPC